MTPADAASALVSDDPIPAVLEQHVSYLSGAAGTGKTYLAKRIATEWEGTVLCATTGIASVNLGEGTTINALLKYFDTASLKDSYVSGQLQGVLGRLFKSGVRRIILDEVSMLDAVQLTVLVSALKELVTYVMDQELADYIAAEGPWDLEGPWPISLVLTGDFAQLPPIKAPFAFEAPEWPLFAERTHQLTTMRRQSDPDFLRALGAARRGDHRTVVEYFASRMVPEMDHAFDGPTVLAKNDAVDRFNALRMGEIRETPAYVRKAVWGKPRADWKEIPDAVELKEGALVMILANRREPAPLGSMRPGAMIYANGDLGTVVGVDRSLVHVRLHRTGGVVEVHHVLREHLIPLEPGRSKALKESGNAANIRDKWEIIGTVEYLPLRVAYATTVHKSQGLSLDKIQLNTRDGMFKIPGMVYVGLSRARTPEGLRLVGSPEGLRTRVSVHPKVLPWV